MNKVKKVLLMSSPFLIFPFLCVPYAYVNSAYLVDLLGCGCVTYFNANDFTLLFLLTVSVCVLILSLLLCKNTQGKRLRILYVTLMLAVSVIVSFILYRMMLWK